MHPQTPASWILHRWKSPFKNPEYAPEDHKLYSFVYMPACILYINICYIFVPNINYTIITYFHEVRIKVCARYARDLVFSNLKS